LFNETLVTSLVATSVATAVPLIYAGLGEAVVERSGVINVGVEAMILTGAFAAFVAASQSHNPVIGVTAGAIAGAAMAGVFALSCLKFKANQVVAGTAINILALGLTGVLFRGIGPDLPQMNDKDGVASIAIPLLSKIPILGESIFSTDTLTYLAILMVPLTALFLSRTRAGQALRAVGELPEAARSAGWNPVGIRLVSILFGGIMAGIAGADLSIDYTHGFTQAMSGGKGFIALAVVIVGRWSPYGVLAGALLFGAAFAAQAAFQAQSTRVPDQVFLALPYVLTLLVLVFRTGRTAAPAALGRDLEAA
jgi:ABC-type uncharacterized transport system permease subunit